MTNIITHAALTFGLTAALIGSSIFVSHKIGRSKVGDRLVLTYIVTLMVLAASQVAGMIV